MARGRERTKTGRRGTAGEGRARAWRPITPSDSPGIISPPVTARKPGRLKMASQRIGAKPTVSILLAPLPGVAGGRRRQRGAGISVERDRRPQRAGEHRGGYRYRRSSGGGGPGQRFPDLYTLSGDDAGSFSIVASTGQLRTRVSLNREAKAYYTVHVSVSDHKDAGGSPDTAIDDTIAVTVEVTNIDEPGTASILPHTGPGRPGAPGPGGRPGRARGRHLAVVQIHGQEQLDQNPQHR